MRINLLKRTGLLLLIFVVSISCGDNDLDIDAPACIEQKIEEVSRAFPDGTQDREDGLTVQFENHWFNLRPSNTEPLLRLNIEADSKENLDIVTHELLRIIRI